MTSRRRPEGGDICQLSAFVQRLASLIQQLGVRSQLKYSVRMSSIMDGKEFDAQSSVYFVTTIPRKAFFTRALLNLHTNHVEGFQ